MIMKRFVRKLKFLIVRPITKKLAPTNKSSIVKHPTKLRQVMKTKNNVPPITRNIVSQAITTERNVTKFPKRSATKKSHRGCYWPEKPYHADDHHC